MSGGGRAGHRASRQRPTVRTDPEFRSLVPPHTPAEKERLEAGLVAEGCRDALVAWKGRGILLDGHNRLEVCERLGLPYRVVEVDLPDRAAAKAWIARNQLARRNLTPFQKAELALALEPEVAAKAKARQRRGGERKVSQKSEKPIDRYREVASVAGVSHDTLAKVKAILADADEDTKEKARRGETSIHAAYQRVRCREKRAVALRKGEAQALEGKYRVIYADPPWQYSRARMLDQGHAESHYPTLSTEEICALPVRDHVQDNAVLFLWTTAPMLEQAFAVIGAWGFTYKTGVVWDKQAHNFGFYFNVQHEHLLVATRGSCTPDIKKLYPSVQRIRRSRRHSEKPVEFRRLIETLYPHGARLEMFARSTHDGWTAWGNEAQPADAPDAGEAAEKAETSLSLYGCARLAARVHAFIGDCTNPEVPVVLVEGQEAADALGKWGFLVLGIVKDAAAPPDPFACLKGRRVLLWPADCGPARSRMDRHAASLAAGAAEVCVLEPPGGDLDAFLARLAAESKKRPGAFLELREQIRESLDGAAPWVPPGGRA